jgi:hypothetical protein
MDCERESLLILRTISDQTKDRADALGKSKRKGTGTDCLPPKEDELREGHLYYRNGASTTGILGSVLHCSVVVQPCY